MTENKPVQFQGNSLGITIILQATLILTILFNVPFARQIVGFLYLTFIPGYAIIRLLKLRLGNVETGLFSVGLSLAFLMGLGFLLNTVGPALELSKPLGLDIILALTSVFVVAVLFVRRQETCKALEVFEVKKTLPLLVALATILVLSILGGVLSSYATNTYTYLTFMMLGSIAILIAVVAFLRSHLPPNVYPLIIFGVALALLLNVSLFSQYLVGFDIFGEYALFSDTLGNLFWNSSYQSSYNAMLSVTILPTTYATVLGLSGPWLFKIIYPVIFALVPVGLFMLFKMKMSREVAFFSAIFFISNIAFFTDLTQLARQMIGEVFYVLLLLMLFNDRINDTPKWVLFTVLGLGLIVSHYALAYVFFASIVMVWVIAAWRKRQIKAVTGSMVVLFGVMTFAWFVYTSSGAAYNNLLISLDSVRTHLFFDFFNPASRGNQVLEAIGISSNTTINTLWHSMGRIQFYIVEVLILVGFAATLIHKRIKFLHDDFNVLILCNLFILAACVVIPNFAATFTISRFYQIALCLLAPLCIIGGLVALKFLTYNRVRRKHLMAILALCVLVPFFLFQTGFIYEIAKDENISLPLSAYRLNPTELAQRGVINGYEVSGATWLAKNAVTDRNIYGDTTSFSIFDYTHISNGAALTPILDAPPGAYVYLNRHNIEGGIAHQYSGLSAFNVSDLSPAINSMGVIYSCGDCEVYVIP